MLLLSFSAAILTVSLTESISTTNRAYRADLFGEWYLAIPDGHDGDAAWLDAQPWADSVGTAVLYAHRGARGMGTLDETAAALGRLKITGRLPQRDGEVALTEGALLACGAEGAALGDTVAVSCLAASAEGDLPVTLEGRFTLVGIIADYAELQRFANNRKNRPFVEIALTPADAQRLCDAAPVAGGLAAPVPQYFVGVGEENRALAAAQTQDYLRRTRNVSFEDWQPCVNFTVYPVESAANSADTLYPRLIALVALAAVLCVYFMQLPAEVHSFSILRSIGITRPQLLALSLTEAALLALPAMLLGIPLGAGLTHLALRLLVYADSIPVAVTLPYEQLGSLLALWFAAVFAARLVIFFVTVRTPLTGKMQLSPRKARRTRRLRRALTVLLLGAFGAAAVYTAAESTLPAYYRAYYASRPYYIISSPAGSVTRALAEQIEQLPGVVRAEGNGLPLSASVTCGGQTLSVALLSCDPRHAAEAAGLTGDALAAFSRGELVLLYAADGAPLPAGDTLRLRLTDGRESTVRMRIAVPGAGERAGLNLGDGAYHVVCSTAYLRALSGQSGGAFDKIEVVVDDHAAALGTALLVRQLSSRDPSLLFLDQTDVFEAQRQLVTQNLILLYSCGGCVALVTLLLLMSALAMEAEQEKRSFAILRVIGMSKRQRNRRLFASALLRGSEGLALGWAAFLGLIVGDELRRGGAATLAESQLADLVRCGFTSARALALTLALLALLLLASLIAKRSLRESARLK